ncbi:MAG: heparinase II/III domain-containing protein, partial [Vibrio sp.]
YKEGPYYHRFAIRPLCVFAEVLHRHMPEISIYDYKDKVIGNTIQGLLATAYPNGEFPALNDASRTMGITDIGVQVAVSLYSKHYGLDDNLLGMAKIQNAVWLNGCGLALSKALEKKPDVGMPYWPSIELNEGPDGTSGAQGFIRMRDQSGDVSQLVMNYGQHGMDHGHFDTLGISFFNRSQEVLREYGYCRWVNIEPKFGGRYLDENKTYARQTIAHNCVTIDEHCQNEFSIERADSVHGQGHFFKGQGEQIQGMSAFANDHYPNVGMQRSVFLLNLEGYAAPLLVDLYRLKADASHQYDYSHQFAGQIVRTNFNYQTNQELAPLGDNFGYQHLWKLAQSDTVQGVQLVSWLQGHQYYTWLGTSSLGEGQMIFTQTGANDPSFNLRHGSSFILRAKGETTLFASVLETHGYFNEEFEQSVDARGQVHDVVVLGHSDEGSVVEIHTTKDIITLMVSNQANVNATTQHALEFNGKTYAWAGEFAYETTQKNAE